MSRGRKPKTILTGSGWEQIFNKSQGFYFQYIVIQLARKNKKRSEENATDLLEKIKQEKEKLIAEKKINKEKPLPEINAEECLFEIPSNWTWCRLGEIVQHNSGKTLDGGRNKGSLREYITTSNLYWGYFKIDNLKQMPIEDEELNRCLAIKGDLLVCEGGEAGRAAVWESETSICFQNHIHRIRPYFNINPYYLFHFFQYLNFSGEINNYRKGMGISNLSGKSLSSIIIPLPPLSEQKMIVDFLRDFGENALDENREYFDLEIENDVVSIHQAQIYNNQISTELNHQLALVKELRQAYLREAIQGNLVPQDSADEPAEILLEKIKEEKDKLVAEKKIRKENLQFTTRNLQTENLFEIPANWAWGKLGTICHLITDGTHHTPSYKETGIPFISVKNISKGSIDFSDTKFISEEEHNELIKRCNPEFGDILLTKVGTTGIAKVVDTARTFSIFVSVALLKFNQTLLNGKFLEFVINSPFVKKQSDDGTWGVGNKNLVLKTIMQFSIPIPPLAEQERIVTKLEKLMKFCDELEANIRQGITNADRLLQTALKEALEDR